MQAPFASGGAIPPANGTHDLAPTGCRRDAPPAGEAGDELDRSNPVRSERRQPPHFLPISARRAVPSLWQGSRMLVPLVSGTPRPPPTRICVCSDDATASALRREFAAAGWTVREVDQCPPAPADQRWLCRAIIDSTSGFVTVVELLLRNVSVVATVDDPSIGADLFDQCRRIATAEWFDRDRRPIADRLGDDQLALLLGIREGHDVAQAARRCHLSPRTAARRLTDARRVLGARSTAEAVSLVGHRIDELRGAG